MTEMKTALLGALLRLLKVKSWQQAILARNLVHTARVLPPGIVLCTSTFGLFFMRRITKSTTFSRRKY